MYGHAYMNVYLYIFACAQFFSSDSVIYFWINKDLLLQAFLLPDQWKWDILGKRRKKT